MTCKRPTPRRDNKSKTGWRPATAATSRPRTRFCRRCGGAQQAKQFAPQAEKTLSAADPGTTANDADYVFITFILHQLPHGVIGLLVAAFFAAALFLQSRGTQRAGFQHHVDIYRHLIRRNATDADCVIASKWFTALWGLVAIGFALFAHLAENLIQAVNILGSIFYGVMLGLFVVAFFIRRVGGTASSGRRWRRRPRVCPLFQLTFLISGIRSSAARRACFSACSFRQ